MELIIESTTKIVTLNGLPARVWEGRTGSGIPVHCYITRIAVKEGLPATAYLEFEKELAEQSVPSAEVIAIPARMIL